METREAIAGRAAVMAAALLVSVMVVLPARAADYPSKPIHVVVTYPAGGATDVVARAIAVRLGPGLKQSIIVENRPGASGMIGTESVARAAPDGYTLTFTAADTHSINPHVYAKIRYDARRDFTPVALVGHLPYALIINPRVQANSVGQLVALAKQSPGKMTFASWGIGSSSQIAMEMFKISAKIELLHVPFQGAAPAITAVIGGQVDAMMVPLTLAAPNHRGGKVRLLGVAAPGRFVSAPDSPTFAEQGMPLNARAWLGFLGPAKVPPEIVNLLNREINSTLQDPQIRDTLVNNGLEGASGTPQEFESFLNSEYERWGNTIRAAKISAE